MRRSPFVALVWLKHLVASTQTYSQVLPKSVWNQSILIWVRHSPKIWKCCWVWYGRQYGINHVIICQLLRWGNEYAINIFSDTVHFKVIICNCWVKIRVKTIRTSTITLKYVIHRVLHCFCLIITSQAQDDMCFL